VGLCAAGGERVLPVAVEEESRRRRPCLAVARRRAAVPAAPSQHALTRAPLGELPTLGFAWLLRVAVQLYSIAALPSVLDLTLGKTLFAKCQIRSTRQTYFFAECFFFSTRQTVYLPSAIILPSVFFAALSKELVCRVSEGMHSANMKTLGKEPVSGSVGGKSTSNLQMSNIRSLMYRNAPC